MSTQNTEVKTLSFPVKRPIEYFWYACMTCFTTTNITFWSSAPINLSPISGYATHAIDLMLWSDAHCIHLNRTVLFTAFYPHLLSVAYLVNRVLFFSSNFISFILQICVWLTHSFSRFIFNLVIVSVLVSRERVIPLN